MNALLEVRELSVAYGRKGTALDRVSLVVPKGGVVALLGANGAGKTTLIRAITGLLAFHGGTLASGDVLFEGRSIVALPSHRRVRLGMGQVPEGRLAFKQLSVEENLRVGGTLLPRSAVARRLEAVYELFPRLGERRGQAAGWMSGGEQQMLALGRALMSEPQMLLVDELSLGLAPLVVRTIYERLWLVGEQLGTSMLVVEQNAKLALEFARTAYVLERGRIVLSGPAEEVARSEAMHESYLGSRRPASEETAA